MSYLVIARKWRPTLFSEIVGQEHVTKTLGNAVTSGRLAHAYIFSGPRGVGKTTAARILSKAVNCENGPAKDPCNECATCLAITAGSSVDVMEIDGASNTSVDNVRELREGIKFMPSSMRKKVYIIDEVHMLSSSAFNALLKTLEEPPEHAIFIFATTEVHKIPRTILSRCQRFDFKRISFKEIAGHLRLIADTEGIKVDDSVLAQLAREAEGSLRDAESLFDQVIAFSGLDIKEDDVIEALGLMDRSLLFDLSAALLSGDNGACLKIIEKIHDFGYDFKKVCLELIEEIRDLTVLKVTGDASLLELPESEAKRLAGLIEGAGIERLQMLFGILSKSYDDVAVSTTPRFTLEMALLRAASLDDLKPVGEILGELKALKSEIDNVAPGALAGSAPPQNESPKASLRSAPLEPRPETKPGPGTNDGGAREATSEYEAAKPQADSGKGASAPAKDATADGFLAHLNKTDRLLSGELKGAVCVVDGNSLSIQVKKVGSLLRDKRSEIERRASEYFAKGMNVGFDKNAGDKEGSGNETIVSEAVKILGGKII